MKRILPLFALLLILFGCGKPQADLLIYNAKIYTVNDKFDIAEAMAVKDGKILAVGSSADILKQYGATEEVDANGKAVYPGFIDAHAHFFGYGESLQSADLTGTTSWEGVLNRITEFAKTHPDGWLTGRGWDQNDWQNKQFPSKEKLDELFPNRPVLLERIDGHASIANQSALNAAGITKSFTLTGGEIVEKDGKLTGLLVDNAVELVANKIPPPDEKKATKMLLDAQKNCFAAGLTTIDDCGLNFDAVEFIEKMHNNKTLKMRLYVMLSDAEKNYDYLFKRGKIKTDRLNVRSFKVYADGALGSRGACLLHPYSDMPNKSGFLLSDSKHFEEVAKKINEHGFQMCTHAIGDSANRTILKIYNQVLGGKNDKRWRIEHAQVVAQSDFNLFGSASVVPSVQPTHATSDMYWAADRLGKERVKGAYAYKQLLDQNGWIPLGTDFPVEQINPMLTFYAATVREDAKDFPQGGFQMENALTPEQALRGMTIWAAKANFEEKEKGSLEVGKFADFVILENDIMKANHQQILQNKVLKTYLNGEKVYENK
ncbi:amidohydrolase family protein [Pedobacter sp. LMG 31464]|uniref:Amidohydrolase family protein n=1 Tax=Pedobacter planticolens TaxID=2679964 RepID=A0A923IVZ9_9SPHI|nr:amidohydrolase [Pedobacter planticolens]MBB2145679.1 amidohydrolase family protein [Pedobacter planticolens]